jgi:hypothetical protein
MLSAGMRADSVEHSRLLDTAPRTTWRVPHTFGRGLAVFGVFSQQHMKRLELAALFFKTTASAESASEVHAQRLCDAARLYAYLLLEHAKAWSQFCEAEQLDKDFFANKLSLETVLSRAEAEAAEVAFDQTEATNWLQSSKSEEADSRNAQPPQLLTAERIATDLRSTLTSLLQRWS